MSATNEASPATNGATLSDLLGRIIDDVQEEWQVGGLGAETMYGEFAIEVAKRAIAKYGDEIERISEETYGVALIEHKEAANWLRSNPELWGERKRSCPAKNERL